MIGFRLEVHDQVTAELRRLQHRLQNPHVLMNQISAKLLSLADAQFMKEEDGDGHPWQKLAMSTIRQRQKKGHWPGKKLQISTGGLLGSMQPFICSAAKQAKATR